MRQMYAKSIMFLPFTDDKVCMVDFMLWPWFERLPLLNYVIPETTISPSEFPQLSSWVQHMYDQPAVKATMFDIEKHAYFIKTYREKRWDYDYGLEETVTEINSKL